MTDNGEEATYLGDGVYASFDGYQVWIAVNQRDNRVVALELDVMRSLVEYANKKFFPKKETRE